MATANSYTTGQSLSARVVTELLGRPAIPLADYLQAAGYDVVATQRKRKHKRGRSAAHASATQTNAETSVNDETDLLSQLLVATPSTAPAPPPPTYETTESSREEEGNGMLGVGCMGDAFMQSTNKKRKRTHSRRRPAEVSSQEQVHYLKGCCC